MTEVVETARPRFYVQAIQNKAKSEAEGRPIFESKTFVELKHPGDRSWSFVEEIDGEGMSLARREIAGEAVGENYALRFPKEYAAFKRGEERAQIGTPLDEWSPLSRTRVAELKAMNIFTVEELSSVPDNMLQKMGMGSRAEREKAIRFIEASKSSAGTDAMASEIAQLRAMVEQLQGKTAESIQVEYPVGEQIGEIVPTSEKTLEQCSDAELKEYIKRETGEGIRGQPSRETLLKRAAEVASAA